MELQVFDWQSCRSDSDELPGLSLGASFKQSKSCPEGPQSGMSVLQVVSKHPGGVVIQ